MPALLPEELVKWQFVESKVKRVMQAYAFQEIELRLLNELNYFNEPLVKTLMWCQKKCTHSMIVRSIVISSA